MYDNTLHIRPATTADAAAWTRANAPKVQTRTMFVLSIPAPVETFGLEYADGDPSHFLMCFPTFGEAKEMQMRLFREGGISGPIVEQTFSRDA